LRVALVSGACVRYDAISYSLRLKLDLLRSLRQAGRDLEVGVFVQGTDLDDPEIRVLSLRDLLLDPDFTDSNLVIYEYGLAYELFDSLFALGPSQRSIGIYHNVTPLELVQLPDARERVKAGHLLRHNLALLDHVACDSEFNRSDLLDCGLPEERLSVLSLPPLATLPLVTDVGWSVDPVEILFVGRLVKAKGVHDLLRAASLLAADEGRGVRLTLAGSTRWSDPSTIDAVQSAAAGQRSNLRIVLDPDDEMLERLYRSSSILAMPSYHEGYCLPVLEAFHAGCQVVAYDSGNLTTIVAGLGQIVPTGDVPGLAWALQRAIAGVRSLAGGPTSSLIPTSNDELNLAEWRAAVKRHVERHSHELYSRDFAGIINKLGIDLRRPTAETNVA
jgi:glycosyltransferase involved in cell wall biosynthesis